MASFTGIQASAGHSKLSLGLVRVGVSLKPMFDKPEAARPTRNNLCPEHHVQVKQKWFCPKGKGHDLKVDETVKAVNLGTPKVPAYVLTNDDEWKAMDVEADHTIELRAWIDTIDPIFFESAYYVYPDTREEAEPFLLIQTLLKEKGGYLLATTIRESTSKVMALHYHPQMEVVVSHICHHEEYLRVVPAQTIKTKMDSLPAPDKTQLKLANEILKALPETFGLESVKDTLGERQWAYVDLRAKAAKNRKTAAGVPATPTTSPDLMQALKDSAAAIKAKAPAKTAPKTPSKDRKVKT